MLAEKNTMSFLVLCLFRSTAEVAVPGHLYSGNFWGISACEQ